MLILKWPAWGNSAIRKLTLAALVLKVIVPFAAAYTLRSFSGDKTIEFVPWQVMLSLGAYSLKATLLSYVAFGNWEKKKPQ